jgi:two-component system LytT family response regulator
MLKAIAIDDEPVALEVIKNLAARISFIELTSVFTDAFKAIEYLQQEKTDLLFLDIKMPDISGIDLLQSLSNPPMVIFTTAYSEHAVQSFELDAIDYLLKPFSLARLLKACSKAQEQFQLKLNKGATAPEPDAVFIKSGVEQIRVELDEILYVESNGNYLQFVVATRKIISRLTMNEAQALLPATKFIRIHRSYFVARQKVSKISSTSVWINQTELPIGVAYAANLKKITG